MTKIGLDQEKRQALPYVASPLMPSGERTIARHEEYGQFPLVDRNTIWHCRALRMRKPLFNRKRHDLLTSFLLAMLLFRAYVPVGFMPASGTPFLLELCPAAAPMPMSMPMPAHHHHSDTHTHFENCPFGSASASGPLPYLGAVKALPPVNLESAPTIELLPVGVRLVYLPQPRGPPLLV
jgi:hypothetical protein